MNTQTQRVLIIDGEPLVVAGVRQIVESIPGLGVAASTGTLANLKNLICYLKPDICVIDPFDLLFARPAQRGIPLVARCLKWNLGTKFIAYVHNAASRHESHFFACGGFAYVNRQSVPDRLEAALRAAITEQTPPSFESLPETFTAITNRHGVPVADPNTVLTAREHEVFRLTGVGMKATQISEHLNISVSSVEHTRAVIYVRLGLDSAQDLYRASALWVIANT